MSRTDEVVTLRGTIVYESNKAILFKIDNNAHEVEYATEKELNDGVWIPFSQVKKIMKSSAVGCDELIVTKWIAEQKGVQV